MQHLADDFSSQQSTDSLIIFRFSQRHQKFLDDITSFPKARWMVAFALIILFVIRIVLLQGWYLIMYALGIAYLNFFIAFLTPKIDPAEEMFEDDLSLFLPTRSNEEFRPFIRVLSEFQFWYSVVKSTLLSMFLTFFKCFDVPVFWPVLVFYFLIIFCITMKRQIMHMIKYRYLPFTHSKPKYQGYDESLRQPLIPLVSVVTQNAA